MMSSILADPPGPRGRRRIIVASVVAAAVMAGLAAVAIRRLADRGALSGELWSVFFDQPELRTLLWDGLLDTLRAAGVAMLLSLTIGAALALLRLSSHSAVRGAVQAAVELFRGLPLLMIILFAYLGLPALGWDLSAFWALVIGLTAYNSAVISEIFRAGILSIDRGQTDAALALGLRPFAVFRLVQLPQATRRMSPTLVSQLVILLKDTSLGFIIGYTELLREGRSAVEYLGGPYAIPVYTVVALTYIVVNGSLSLTARWLERRQAGKLGGTATPAGPENLAPGGEVLG
jgi:glutamate transport system permease protein